jgi:hypothetical protein
VYLAYKAKGIKAWLRVIGGGFADLRKAGLDHHGRLRSRRCSASPSRSARTSGAPAKDNSKVWFWHFVLRRIACMLGIASHADPVLTRPELGEEDSH